MLLGAVEGSESCDPFEISTTPDQTLVVVTRGTFTLSAHSRGAWRSALRTVGSVGLTPGGQSSRLRWAASVGETFETAHIYLPQALFAVAADELRASGAAPAVQALDAIALPDPLLGNLAMALARAQRSGETELLAATIAQALVVRLLSLRNAGFAQEAECGSPRRLGDRRLKSVLSYIQEFGTTQLTLEALAAQAGYSRFHFARAFRAAVGVSPHRYVMICRLQKAAEMLAASDASAARIAVSCGFSSGTHLAGAFKQHFHCTPMQHRAMYRNTALRWNDR